jgi:hypothetical protein
MGEDAIKPWDVGWKADEEFDALAEDKTGRGEEMRAAAEDLRRTPYLGASRLIEGANVQGEADVRAAYGWATDNRIPLMVTLAQKHRLPDALCDNWEVQVAVLAGHAKQIPVSKIAEKRFSGNHEVRRQVADYFVELVSNDRANRQLVRNHADSIYLVAHKLIYDPQPDIRDKAKHIYWHLRRNSVQGSDPRNRAVPANVLD